MATFVVAGVTGRVGSAVAAELAARGQHVRGISRGADGGGVAQGSLDDADFLTRTLAGADGFFALLPEDPFAADFHGDRRAMADAMATAVPRAAYHTSSCCRRWPHRSPMGTGQRRTCTTP